MPKPHRYAIIFAFAVLYISWGTTYLAIKLGLQDLPPLLFAGTRLAAAGLILLIGLCLFGQSIRVDRQRLRFIALTGFFFFMGGNGFLTYAQTMVASGMAAVLVSPTPLYFALMEWLTPAGERLTRRGWLGLALGLCGVVLLLLPKAETGSHFLLGFVLATTSSISWAFGGLLVRHKLPRTSPFVVAGYQMLIGGAGLTIAGLVVGEAALVKPAIFTQQAVTAFFYLLVVGSLGGFVAYNFLLAHVSPALVSTHAYVNPMVALLVGWLWLGEPITPVTLGSMSIILTGVALLRAGGVRKPPEDVPSIPRHSGVHLTAPSVDAACKR